MITFNPIKNTICSDFCTVKVGYRESLILSILLDRSPNIVPKQDIICHAWGSKYIGVTSLSKSISILRQSFVKLGMKDSPIITVPKVGYRLINNNDIQNIGGKEGIENQSLTEDIEKNDFNSRFKNGKFWVNTTASFILLLSLAIFFSGKERFDLSLLKVEEEFISYKNENLELFIKSKYELNENIFKYLKGMNCNCVIYIINDKYNTSISLYNKKTNKAVNLFFGNEELNNNYNKLDQYLDTIERDV